MRRKLDPKLLSSGTKVRGKEHHQITAYRCSACGYIEFYADPAA